MNKDQLVYNGIRTPDGTVISSRHRHDFVCHEDANGYSYSVDGGLDYLKRGTTDGGKFDYEELSLTLEASHDTIRRRATWGALRDGQYEWILIKDLETAHIQAILEGGHAQGVFKKIIQEECDWRTL